MSGTDWWDRWDEVVQDAEDDAQLRDARVEAWLDSDDDDTPADDNKATDSKSAAETKPDKAPEPKPNVPATPDFSNVDNATSLDEAIAAANEAIAATRPKPEPVQAKSPAEVRAELDALELPKNPTTAQQKEYIDAVNKIVSGVSQ